MGEKEITDSASSSKENHIPRTRIGVAVKKHFNNVASLPSLYLIFALDKNQALYNHLYNLCMEQMDLRGEQYYFHSRTPLSADFIVEFDRIEIIEPFINVLDSHDLFINHFNGIADQIPTNTDEIVVNAKRLLELRSLELV